MLTRTLRYILLALVFIYHPSEFFSQLRYQVPDEILDCPLGVDKTASHQQDQQHSMQKTKKKKKTKNLKLVGNDRLLPEPPDNLTTVTRSDLRNIFAHCAATRATNQAARDYRRWFCRS